MTLGYGAGDARYLIDGDPHRCYRTDFGGTCSAASIVTGAIASLQGVVRNQVSASLTPGQMRYLLAVTGTPQAPGRQIGSRPDLRRALALLFEAAGPDVYVPSAATDGSVPTDPPLDGGSESSDPLPAPVLQLAGTRLRIYLDSLYQGSYSFSDDGSIAFAKLDGSVDRRLRFTQSGSDLTLFTATGWPIRGSVSATGFTASLPGTGGRTHVLSGAP
jgi:hypothetical protein